METSLSGPTHLGRGPVPIVTVEAGVVTVVGVIDTPYVCDPVSVAVVETAGRVTVRLTALRATGGCVTAGGSDYYRVTGTPRAGRYRLVVEYVYPGREWYSEVRFDGLMVVP